ncbi:ubiquitin carboxyl-terminal hydrolase 26 isoform X1 [Herrania umbratica]|uniref:Ubiquitin carboxyl-terminal hydrolase 26 n=2 Tax=Herrania umbratica TaxID=108875 RepID=A0A6J0ZP64_9ROSI|nr:ubiquitin carboxyl-terminal hydrolase 26 isoform X1 [Herrania umbratica]
MPKKISARLVNDKMSRPTTRSKNKRHRQVENDDATSEILRKIHATGQITDDDVFQLYMITKPVCQGCRMNTKDNPNCFCGLIPPPNGSRKTGLWQKISDIVQALGPDPFKDLRASAYSPAGLTNLGATCYANSILQCLYMNKSFRQGVFSVEPDILEQHPVLDQLARLFAQLHASKMAFIDSAPFIKTLELDNGVQQDSHEFLTLLFSLLERCLSHSKVTKARTIVQDLFRGSVSHVTTCSKCGKDSEASSKMEDFYEVELNVKGLKTLDESLNDYLSVEELHGDNQYFCESCSTRVDASRSIKLRILPDVLNFQLKRYDFLQKTTTKKKISSLFSFPGELDMRGRLSEPSQVELIYDLSAVLIHKGTAANSGHYIAHIKDENTGLWWEFDDEHVSNLGHHPFGEGSSTSNTKSIRAEPVVYSSCIGVDGTANGNHLDQIQQQHAESSIGSHVEIFSSTDAYMIMYNLRCNKKNDVRGCTMQSANSMELEGDAVFLHDGISLPSHLFQEIKDLNSSYDDACEQYKLKKERELEHITARRQEVRSVLSEAPVHSVEEPFYWISTDWLRQWADNITPPVLNNTSIQCFHGKVPVSKVGFVKRLSAKAWMKLFSKYNGGPTLAKADYCMECLIDVARTVVCADSYRDRRKLMKEIADNVLLGKCMDGTYYVSKAWLQQWVKRKNLDAPSEADAGPTMSITCPHGHLMPEQAAGAKRLLVPEKLWLFFYEDAITIKPDEPSGCSTFPFDSEECPECSNALSEVACLEDSIRAVKLKQRQNHEKLATGKSIPLSLNCKYYLVPSSWLSKWRSYITASGKNISSMEPENLDGTINLLKCEKHLRLLERPPKVVCKRGSYFQKGSTTDRLTIITENDWKCFCEEWGGTEEDGISAVIELSSTENLAGCCEDMPISVQQLDLSNEVNNEVESRQLVIRTCPEACEECIGERESCELMQKLNYADEEIYVYLVRGKEAPKSILQASEYSEPDRRTSKRSRRTNNGNLLNLKVSASTSIYQLKMMIWESLGVVKENQILHKGSRIIDQEMSTLADMNIFPGDRLWVKDSEIHEDRDIADELSDQKLNVDNIEEGFRGTLLTANISSQVV